MARLSGPKEQFDDESAFKWGSCSRFLTLQRGRSLVSEKHRLDQRCLRRHGCVLVPRARRQKTVSTASDHFEFVGTATHC
jgi:hypothetical protein